MTVVDRDELAARLSTALPGVRLINIGDQTPGWLPEPGRCHENARRWVEGRPTFRIVHGWLNAVRETFENRLRFHAHSVVRGPDGDLLDITLGSTQPRFGFVRHPFDDTHFREQIIGRLPTVDHLLGPDPEPAPGWDRIEPDADHRFF